MQGDLSYGVFGPDANGSFYPFGEATIMLGSGRLVTGEEYTDCRSGKLQQCSGLLVDLPGGTVRPTKPHRRACRPP